MAIKKYKRKKESVALNDEISEFISSMSKGKEGLKKSSQKKSMNLLVCWKKVAPPRMLEHTDSVVYVKNSEDTELMVFLDSSAYAAELTMDKELYRLKMQQELGKDIKDISFFISRKSAFRKQSKG